MPTCHTRQLKPQIGSARRAAGGNEQVGSRHAAGLAGLFDAEHHAVALGLHAQHFGALANGQAFGRQTAQQRSRQFLIVLGHALVLLEHRDPRAEVKDGLRHLHTERSAAEHDQVLGQARVFEQRFVGEVRHPIEPFDRW